MTTRERRQLLLTALWGIVLTLAVVLLAVWHVLDPLERWAYDARARTCQFFRRPPTDRLVQVDLDDASLEAIGRWPWPRATQAQIIDELHAAGAKAVALDFLYSEPQPPRLLRRPDGSVETIDDDADFAAALRRAGRALVPSSVHLATPRPPLEQAVYEQLLGDLELTPEQIRARLQAKGMAPASWRDVDDAGLLEPRRDALFERVYAELLRGPAPLAAVRARLLPQAERALSQGAYSAHPLLRALQTQYDRAQAVLALRSFSQPVRPDLPRALPVRPDLPPIPVLAAAARSSGYVTYYPDPDGVLRCVPLWVATGDRMYPQFALALACLMLDVPIADVKLERDRIILPRPGAAPLVIPVYRRQVESVGGREVGWVLDIPWFGPPDWERMYGPEKEQHLPAAAVWDVVQLRQRIATDTASADEAVRACYRMLYEEYDKEIAKLPALRDPPDQIEGRLRLIDETLQAAKPWADQLAAMSPADVEAEIRRTIERERQEKRDLLPRAELDAALRQVEADLRLKNQVFAASVQALPETRRQLVALRRLLEHTRANLRARLEGRAVIVGWVASATFADAVPTSIHRGKCPGPVVHGVILSGILTGDLWREAPPWAGVATTLALGLLATAGVVLLAPWRSLLATLTLGVGFALFNGLVLFDYGNLILTVAPPLAAVTLVWAGCTLVRFVTERSERARITERFRTRVDPALVDYVIESGGRAHFRGEERELTVVYTDLAGFTALSEKLGPGIVPLLNEYMSRMIPVIRRHHGYVNKLLGDGIMFFYGAPRRDERHAAHAVTTVLEMRAALALFHQELARDGLPAVAMRAGISTGTMVVGDAGSTDPQHRASDYTVLGDLVNLGSRLETANKALGTATLCTARTVELAGGGFVFRPIGRLQVVGKHESVMVFEPLAPAATATAAQKQLAEWSREMTELFFAGKFAACLAALAKVEESAGASGLTAIYRALCETYLRQPPTGAFDGQIVLREK